MKALARAPYAAFLFGWYSVLYLYSQNAEHTTLGATVLPLVVATVAVALIVLACFLLFRDAERTAVASAILTIAFIAYGHVWVALQGKTVAGVVVGRDVFLIPLWVLLGAAALWWTSRLRSRREVTRIVKVIGAFLLVFVIVQSALAWRGQRPDESIRAAKAAMQVDIGAKRPSDPRSVYYLIFDRYSGPSTLKEHLKFSNDAFYDDLRERGFFVADESVSNYPKTVSSLASSLNLGYLDPVAQRMGRDSPNWTPLYDLMLDSNVADEFRRIGYRHVHVGSPWTFLARNPDADTNLRYGRPLPEFLQQYLNTTAFRPVIKRVDALQRHLDIRALNHGSTLFQFSTIADLARDPQPKFVFSHFMVPHDPYTFDAEGRWVPEEVERSGKWWEQYAAQLTFTNKKIIELVDGLLAGPDTEDPIVILQADEGMYPHNILYGLSVTDWDRAPKESIRWKFPILNAYHFPGGDYSELRRDTTPVNSFRAVFNQFFGTDLAYLRENSFVFGNGLEPYKFRDVTKIVRSKD